MRIRKRFAPSSSLEVSDPQLNRPVVVQQVIKHPFQEPTKNVSQPSDTSIQPLPRPSDHPAATGSEATRWVFAGDNNNQEKIEEKELEDDEDEKWREEDKSFSTNDNDNKKENLLTQPSSYSTLDGRWCEGDRVVPLKKRRGSYDISIDEAIKKAKMKSKTNKKCDLDNGDDHQEGVDGTRRIEEKKSKRGNIIMEGSRCSRVNGRGWRCCQQTLVGYSLCEHHLGKGRLRSMSTSVRNASKIKCESKKLLVKQEENVKKSLSSCSVEDHDHYGDNDNDIDNDNDNDNDNDDDDDDDDDEKKKKAILKVRKKKMNLGMVKARSLSSLLGQTDNVVVAIVDNINKEQ